MFWRKTRSLFIDIIIHYAKVIHTNNTAISSLHQMMLTLITYIKRTLSTYTSLIHLQGHATSPPWVMSMYSNLPNKYAAGLIIFQIFSYDYALIWTYKVIKFYKKRAQFKSYSKYPTYLKLNYRS